MRIKIKIISSALLITACIAPALLKATSSVESSCASNTHSLDLHSLPASSIAEQLGWVATNDNRCGGYYLEAPFVYPEHLLKNHLIEITSQQGLFSLHGTSISQGKVTITRYGQQIVANRAYLYRDPTTNKINAVDLMDHVVLREPNSMVIAERGHLDIPTKAETLNDLLYRTAVYSSATEAPPIPNNQALQQPRKITQLSAWGKAAEFKQAQPHIYELKNASYSTCPPLAEVWHVQAQTITLNKDTGRGTARNSKLYVKNIPVFYTPYFNFPIDSRRQTGFLPPTVGTSTRTGAYARTPFYWNLAPNYDTTITPAYMAMRGLQIGDVTRYLTPSSNGKLSLAVLPNDKEFSDFQTKSLATYNTSTDPAVQTELTQLENDSDTRKSISWQNDTRFNEHWTGNVDYSYVSDDYYLRDLSNNFNEVTQNQILQKAEVDYQGHYWNFAGRTQAYQTLHPIDETPVSNQYTSMPDLVLNGDYPKGPGGLDYFVANDLTRFEFHDNPGQGPQPVGDRLYTQPGISLPIYHPSYYFKPRLQLSLTQYKLADNSGIPAGSPTQPDRALPIVDIDSGLYFDRDVSVFDKGYRQTLEPRLYYVYIPSKNQNNLPIFDTTENNLTYDELFLYNRFSGFDRIGDADQMSLGVITRLIEDQTGFEKFNAGVGQIYYFRHRDVDLCYNNNCQATPAGESDNLNRSPLSGVLKYNLNPLWSATANTIWNPQQRQLDDQSLTISYTKDPLRVINFGYSYIYGGDQQPGTPPNSSANNLSQTDASFGWPIKGNWSLVGRWTQNWNHHHFQNLLSGLQYDSCCWAVRFITGRSFLNLSANNTYQYDTQFFVQLALKGLGNVGNADPTQLISTSIAGYQSNFGQDF